MHQQTFFLVALAIISFGWSSVKGHHNGTCTVEEETARNCIKKFFEAKKANRSSNNSLSQDEAERCFTSNGCQKPLFQGQQIEADIERIKICKQQLRQKTQSAMKECLEKKAPDRGPFDDDRSTGGHEKDEQEKRACYLRWALAKQSQDTTICPVPANGEKVRTCLKEISKRPLIEENEKGQKEFCNAKQDCMKDISTICQEHMNITRSFKCECNRERNPILKQEFHDCIGITATNKDENQENFWDGHHCKNLCPTD